METSKAYTIILICKSGFAYFENRIGERKEKPTGAGEEAGADGSAYLCFKDRL
ncbi:MAG: hypothetical protein K2H52_07520 [Lachnospiraceae bacterium]|nr:hypothetical protein [Lachnospiraceae bacterium]